MLERQKKNIQKNAEMEKIMEKFKIITYENKIADKEMRQAFSFTLTLFIFIEISAQVYR